MRITNRLILIGLMVYQLSSACASQQAAGHFYRGQKNRVVSHNTMKKNKKEVHSSTGPILFFGFMGGAIGWSIAPKIDLGDMNINAIDKMQYGFILGFVAGGIIGYKIDKAQKTNKDEDETE